MEEGNSEHVQKVESNGKGDNLTLIPTERSG